MSRVCAKPEQSRQKHQLHRGTSGELQHGGQPRRCTEYKKCFLWTLGSEASSSECQLQHRAVSSQPFLQSLWDLDGLFWEAEVSHYPTSWQLIFEEEQGEPLWPVGCALAMRRPQVWGPQIALTQIRTQALFVPLPTDLLSSHCYTSWSQLSWKVMHHFSSTHGPWGIPCGHICPVTDSY